MIRQLEEIDTITVGFWDKQGEGAECIFNYTTTVYPNYRPGDTIWLPKFSDNTITHFETKYTVYAIQHIVRNYEGTIGIQQSLEVFVKPAES